MSERKRVQETTKGFLLFWPGRVLPSWVWLENSSGQASSVVGGVHLKDVQRGFPHKGRLSKAFRWEPDIFWCPLWAGTVLRDLTGDHTGAGGLICGWPSWHKQWLRLLTLGDGHAEESRVGGLGALTAPEIFLRTGFKSSWASPMPLHPYCL